MTNVLVGHVRQKSSMDEQIITELLNNNIIGCLNISSVTLEDSSRSYKSSAITGFQVLITCSFDTMINWNEAFHRIFDLKDIGKFHELFRFIHSLDVFNINRAPV